MTLRDKIAAIINECLLHDDDQVSDYIYCQSYTGKELADEINAALPDYDAQQARIKELEAELEAYLKLNKQKEDKLEAYLKLNKQKGDAQDRKLEAQEQLALKGDANED